MNNAIDSYLKAALDFWKEELTKIQRDSNDPKKGLPKAYKGYIASFGTAVIHCGLLPAVFMFSRTSENSRTDEDKTWVLRGVLQILKKRAEEESQRFDATDLLHYALSNNSIATARRVCDASVALKLALRTFKLD